MDAATLTAVGAILAAVLTAAAAMYGHRGAHRATLEGTAVTGLTSLTDQLQEERKELRTELVQVRTELAAERAESARLRLLLVQRGGTP